MQGIATLSKNKLFCYLELVHGVEDDLPAVLFLVQVGLYQQSLWAAWAPDNKAK